MNKEKIKGKPHREEVQERPVSEVAWELSRMERMFDDFLGRPWRGWSWPECLRFREDFWLRTPAIEIYEEKDDVVVKAELPGMHKEDLEIHISGNLLTLKGEKKKEEKVREKEYYYSERSFGSFHRSIEISKAVQPDKARASFKDGVLEIRLPKTDEPRRKEIKLRVE